jgi:mannosyltransferase OCH1-like enzyme
LNGKRSESYIVTISIHFYKGCKALNPDHEFKMYYDADLLDFVKKSYPQYLALFQSLKGVYMADMARVLVIYHYGGIYTDLDFYCHRCVKLYADLDCNKTNGKFIINLPIKRISYL